MRKGRLAPLRSFKHLPTRASPIFFRTDRRAVRNNQRSIDQGGIPLRELLKTHPHGAYSIFWTWLGVVTALFPIIYEEMIAPFSLALSNSLVGLTPNDFPYYGTWAQEAIYFIAALFFWWRGVKVFVLHGAPIPFGLEVAEGRQDKDSGRPVA